MRASAQSAPSFTRSLLRHYTRLYYLSAGVLQAAKLKLELRAACFVKFVASFSPWLCGEIRGKSFCRRVIMGQGLGGSAGAVLQEWRYAGHDHETERIRVTRHTGAGD